MKKIFIILTCVISGIASGVTMNWASATAIKFGGTSLKSDGNVSGYLVYLSSGTLAGSYTVDSAFSAEKIGTLVDTKDGSSAMSKISKDWSIDTATYGNGDSFAMLLVYNDPTSKKTYFNLSSTIGKIANMSLDPPVNSDGTSFAYTYSNGNAGTLTAGGGWVAAAAVPEPATGALALAGIALLLKRRKTVKA